MNRAAGVVLFILGFSGIGCVVTLCLIASRTSDGKDIKELAVFCLGVVGGVLAKVGYDGAKAPPIGPITGEATTIVVPPPKENE